MTKAAYLRGRVVHIEWGEPHELNVILCFAKELLGKFEDVFLLEINPAKSKWVFVMAGVGVHEPGPRAEWLNSPLDPSPGQIDNGEAMSNQRIHL